ncbi:AarF/ABC1/UbiB kinase family protein [bacterium]|nr:AarF/ABC1/UbiB kinase family protein [bacterium]
MSKDSIPKSIFARSSKLLGTAARIGKKEILHRFSGKDSQLSKQVEQAELLVETLSRLKGAAMKTGQMLSLDIANLLPEEVVKVFSKLQKDSQHFMAQDEVIDILKKDLGENFSRLSNISPNPIAAASIGQVHLAQFENQSLAIKIQYPGVAESVDSDINTLKGVVKSLLRLSGRKISIEALFKELSSVLKMEVDYEREALMLQKVHTLCEDISYYCVPKVFPEISTSKVLSMSFESGIPLRDWIDREQDQEKKDLVGSRLLELYCREFFEWGMVQTDPNHANFLIKPESLSLVLLDFGALKIYDQGFITTYRNFIKDVYNNNIQNALETAYEIDFIQPSENQATKDAFIEMIKASLESLDPKRQPFDFADQDYFKRARDTSLAFSKSVRFTAPPHRILFLHRKLAGVYGTLKRLGVKKDVSEFWKRWILD